jgi:hypothetical protein
VRSVRQLLSFLWLSAWLSLVGWTQPAPTQDGNGASRDHPSYFGFDKNEYPGADLLAALHRSFAYTGYWLNNPPGASNNSWRGKRALIRSNGFGFLILFNGRVDAQLVGKDAAALGRMDAAAAISAAAQEGFPSGAILFLDLEEGGRLLPEQRAYVFEWITRVRQSRYKPGVYCSGIETGAGADRISTAEDILRHTQSSSLALWVVNDQCPPSPGCTIPRRPPSVSSSGAPQALVWQYALTPRRPQWTRQCAATYAADGNCYAPGVPRSDRSFVDFNVSKSADPSAGR